jgi:two-component system alkaline phosphatase synthesis response regulator PhoP
MNNLHAKVLLVDDESDILEFMGYNLRNEGYAVEVAQDGKEALEVAKRFVPDLIILDVMMPGMDGVETCAEIRKMPTLKHCIITFLSARGEDFTQIAAFNAGADDYISKPIRPKVLLSRVAALLRRKPLSDASLESQENELRIELGDLVIDRESFQVISKGQTMHLPKKEFELLSLLASKPGKVFARHIILNRVWGDDVVVGDRTIDVHIRKLREKLGENYIKTVKGVGYKFEF